MKNFPQIIYICLFLISLIMAGYKHGKTKTEISNGYTSVMASVTMLLLLYWGGFFDCFAL